jgi:hypothetical protein
MIARGIFTILFSLAMVGIAKLFRNKQPHNYVQPGYIAGEPL